MARWGFRTNCCFRVILGLPPGSSSPAVDAGDPALPCSPARDAQGTLRVVGGRIDIGAIELYPDAPLPVVTDISKAGNPVVTYTVTAERGTIWRIEISETLQNFTDIGRTYFGRGEEDEISVSFPNNRIGFMRFARP